MTPEIIGILILLGFGSSGVTVTVWIGRRFFKGYDS